MGGVERDGAYYGDVPNRAVALLVDAVCLTAIIFVAAIFVSVIVGPAVHFDSGGQGLGDVVTVDRGVATLDSVISLALSAGYFAVSWVVLGASLGQRALVLRVGNETDGAPLSFGRALARWAALAAPFGIGAVLVAAAPGVNDAFFDVPVVAWYLFLAVSTARSPTKQGLHDRLAHSIVAKEARPVRWRRPAADDL